MQRIIKHAGVTIRRRPRLAVSRRAAAPIALACGVVATVLACPDSASAQQRRRNISPDYHARVDVLPAEQRRRSCGTYRYWRAGRCLDARDKK